MEIDDAVYKGMYNYVLRDCPEDLKDADDIIHYLVSLCFYIKLDNTQLQGKLDEIMQIVNRSDNIIDDDVPF